MATTYPAAHDVKKTADESGAGLEKGRPTYGSDHLMYAWSFDDHDKAAVEHPTGDAEKRRERSVPSDCPPEAYLG